jgi:hypothetical protein
MFIKLLVVIAFTLRLFFSTEAVPTARATVQKDGAGCVGNACLDKCCTSKACCAGAQQQETPRSPALAAPQPEFQVAVVDSRLFALLYARAAGERDFIAVDGKSGGHALPPLVTSCIQLI